MKRNRLIKSVAALLAAGLFSKLAIAQTPAACDRQLTVELTPDVPDPRDVGFLSSLLGNQLGYQLIFERIDGADVVLELMGPGPGYRCRSVVQAIRKDGRVLSIHVSPRRANTASNAALDLATPDVRSLPLLGRMSGSNTSIEAADTQDIDAQDPEEMAVVSVPAADEKVPAVQVSTSGLGAVYWAALHPAQALKIVLPESSS